MVATMPWKIPTRPPPGKAPNCNEIGCDGKMSRFQRFANASNAKLWGSACSQGRPEHFPKWKPSPAWSPSRLQLQHAHRIAVDGQIPARQLPATRCTILQGCGRLRLPIPKSSVATNLVIMRDAARLHACGPSDWEHLCDLIYIIGLGLPVVMASTWRLAAGCPSQLAAQSSGIFLHAPCCQIKPCTFILDHALATEHPALARALRYCGSQPKSKWVVKGDKGQPLVAGAVKPTCIQQLAATILNLRTLEKDACRVYCGPTLA